MWCGVVWCGVVWCGVVWCGVVFCSFLYCSFLFCSVLICTSLVLVLSCTCTCTFTCTCTCIWWCLVLSCLGAVVVLSYFVPVRILVFLTFVLSWCCVVFFGIVLVGGKKGTSPSQTRTTRAKKDTRERCPEGTCESPSRRCFQKRLLTPAARHTCCACCWGRHGATNDENDSDNFVRKRGYDLGVILFGHVLSCIMLCCVVLCCVVL